MPATPFRDVIEELEARRMTQTRFADEAGVSEEHVAYWIALAKLRRFREPRAAERARLVRADGPSSTP